MQKDIVLGGVGGQGILTIAATIGTAAVNKGLYLKQSEVHGMSQRGGDVMSNLRLSSNPIFSDLIPEGKADLLIGVEPLEALRHVNMLSKDGWLITNEVPFKNISNYPYIDKIMEELRTFPKHVILNADAIAKDLGSLKAANMVILGAAIPFIGLELDDFKAALKMIFGRKGDDIVNLNIKALEAGMKEADKFI
jgi:indolepyruvate ferredoxin oxidoreductase beta subunit